jgi:hypothetical protein
MKIQRFNFHGGRAATPPKNAMVGERGSITVIFIVLLAIMMILVTAESRALFQLHREVKFLEQQQIKRLNASTTNTIVTVPPESK